ncbi:MAG: site-specific DNA-methyltransferase [Megasphaera sp.]|nr:site-specific DNA-methyltransferase [Megasphaera sp.]
MAQLDGKTLDIKAENIESMKQLFPEAFEEGKVDFDKLKQLLGDYVDDSTERYNFTWNGKGKSLCLSQTPSVGTLRPCKEESKDWDTTQNLYIEGDNLEVLKLLQKSYHNKIKMIYIDPPYNTGHDFVYQDNFKDSIENYKKITGQVDNHGNVIGTNTETSGRYHTNWLTMMFPRLRLARNLLSEDGVIFISIDDNEQSNLKSICNEIFGENNFVAQINWKGRGGRQDSKYFAIIHEYILCYAKSIDNFVAGEETKSEDTYPKYDTISGKNYKTQLLRKWGSNSRRENRPNLYYPIKAPDGSDVYPMLDANTEGRWRWGKETMKNAEDQCIIEFVKQKDGSWIPYEKIYEPQVGAEKTKKFNTWIDNIENGTDAIKTLFGFVPFDYTKSPTLIERFLKMANVKDDDTILDFFSGSATAADALMYFNKQNSNKCRYIMVQLPEQTDSSSDAYKRGFKNICEIGKERIRLTGEQIKTENPQKSNNVDIGFKNFKLDTSNIKKWQADADTLNTALEFAVDNIVAGRSEMDVVYEIILKMGLSLTYPIVEHDVNGKKVYVIGDGALMICLDTNITLDVAEGMTSLKKEYQPETWKVVFYDNGFIDDQTKTNSKEILKNAGLDKDAFTTI